MGGRIREWWGLSKHTEFMRGYLLSSNMRAVLYMAIIVCVLEVWMILSLARRVAESAAAGTPRDMTWIVNHGAWYVVLLATALLTLVQAMRYLRGKTRSKPASWGLLALFSVTCLVFGIHFGQNSYAQGEQVLAFVTMTLYVFGILVWNPVVSLVASVTCFGVFYLLIDASIPATYGTQVNLFTLWISTFVVSLSAYHQKVSEAKKAEGVLEANAHLQHLATFDELTEIPNMHTFRAATRVLFEGTDELDTHFSVVFLDIENFKYYNERMGFPAGDQLLRDFAQGLTKVFENELVARFSDDHFVALCPTEAVSERYAAAHELLRGLRGNVRLHLKVGAFEPEGEHGLSVSRACDKARMACESVKRQADRSLAFYDEALDALSARRHHVIANVKRAVAEGWIKVYYQPIVSCGDGSGTLVGYEALARWMDPELGLLPPYAFIDTLEQYREIDRVDREIISQVCRDLRHDLDAGREVVPVSLNFSRLDFELFDVPAYLEECAREAGIPASLLDVEITESALTEQFDELRKNMDRLRRCGFSLWLDDFGSGYSSLNVLKDFSFDVLKIDMAFLRGFLDNPRAGMILRQVVGLAKELGLTTLCEGVETLEQFEFLHSIGCDRAQGYYFGRPEPTKATPAAI